MAICSRCSSAIQQLRPQDRPSKREDREVVVEVPILGRADVNCCWICFKFSAYLEAKVPGLLNEWRMRSLQVKFTTFGRVYREGPELAAPLLLSINISPLGLEEDDAGCEIELNFMTATGILSILKYGVLRVSSS